MYHVNLFEWFFIHGRNWRFHNYFYNLFTWQKCKHTEEIKSFELRNIQGIVSICALDWGQALNDYYLQPKAKGRQHIQPKQMLQPTSSETFPRVLQVNKCVFVLVNDTQMIHAHKEIILHIFQDNKWVII